MMNITPRKRTKILTLHKHTGNNQQEIARTVGDGQSTVSRLLKQAQSNSTLSLQRKEKCGRKRKTSTTDIIWLWRERKKDFRKTNNVLRKNFSSAGVDISTSTSVVD